MFATRAAGTDGQGVINRPVSALVAILLMVGVALVCGIGCRSRNTPAPSTGAANADAHVPSGIGFRLDGDPHVARGALVTTPPGREEAFLPFVAGGAPTWVSGCLNQPGRSPLIFRFDTDGGGNLKAAPLPSSESSAQARCVATRALDANTTPPAPRLTADTQVTVELALHPQR